jgi:hypothetical protein
MNRGGLPGYAAPFLNMKYSLSLFFFTVFAASVALPQSNTTNSNTTTKKSKTVAKTAATPKKTASSKKTVVSKKGKSSKKSVAATRQMAPTPDRYKEIQQALVDKGYLKSEPNGVWDAQSMDALRQFQTDKKLSPTGKLSSASLIALGLGPKTAAASPGQPTAPVEAPAAAPLPAVPAPTQEN